MKSPYLYLNEVHHADAWVNGGKVPIRRASFYRSQQRNGIYTPDENIINTAHKFNEKHDLYIKWIESLNADGLPCGVIGLAEGGCIAWFDGLILSFCQVYSIDTMRRLGNKKACIRINDIYLLKKCIDKQLKCVGKYQKCEYTNGGNRNHFLKSMNDKWQQEWRIFWDLRNCNSSQLDKLKEEPLISGGTDKFWVDLPRNIAKIVHIKK